MLSYKVKKKGDYMPQHDFDILTVSQITGPHKLEIFTDGITAKQTDLVTLLGGDNSYNAYDGSPNGTIEGNGTIHHYCLDSTKVGIRPVISFEKIADGIISKYINEDGILEVEYGYYPQNLLISDECEQTQWINDTMHAKYTNNVYHPNNNNAFSEHEYNGNRYIIFYTMLTKNKKYSEKLSNGEEVDKDKAYFIKVEPIKWLVDKKSGLAISKYILSYTEIYNTKKFLTKFSHEITQIKPPSHIGETMLFATNQKTDEVSSIIAEIKKYIQFYHGKNDINERVNDLIAEYNAKLNKSLTSGSILTLETSDKDILYMKLLADLNIILDGLKMNYENNKVYHDILSLIDNCLSLIKKRTVLPTSDLEQDVKTLIDTIIPYLADDKYLDELKAIFEEQKQIISFSLENMEKLNSKVNGKYKTVSEFELTIRKKLNTYLKQIYFAVNNKHTQAAIVANFKKAITDNYQRSKQGIAAAYLNTINELSTYIKQNGTEEEISKMKELLLTINDNANLDTIVSGLVVIIKELYLIYLNIEERKDNQKLKEAYTIKLKKVKIN